MAIQKHLDAPLSRGPFGQNLPGSQMEVMALRDGSTWIRWDTIEQGGGNPVPPSSRRAPKSGAQE
jgi:hypothetical protein